MRVLISVSDLVTTNVYQTMSRNQSQKLDILWIRCAELSQIVAQRRCCSSIRDNTEAEGHCRKNLNSHVTRV